MKYLIRLLYTGVLWLLSPFILLALFWPRSGRPSYGNRWPEFLGQTPVHAGSPVWIHAVSVGEVMAAIPLIKAIKSQWPDLPIVVTTTTATGAQQVASLGDLVTHRYAPLDYPVAIRCFLQRINPRALVIMETELWPNWLLACKKYSIPVALVNARLSARSFRRYQKTRPLFALMAPVLRQVLCQHEDDADRFSALGVDTKRLFVTGSIKFDIAESEVVTDQGRQLRQQLGQQRPTWIAASTHEGEDELLLSVHEKILQIIPDALLILVPRHPQRFSAVSRLITDFGFNLQQRSQPWDKQQPMDVYLGDTMGELSMMMATADLVFMGGSLVPVGGHNVLESAALGKPILTGSHYFNFQAIVDALSERQGILIVKDKAQLTQQLLELFADKEKQVSLGETARNFVMENRGATEKTVKLLQRLLG